MTGKEILVGRSDRTDAEGVAELAGIAAEWGHSLREVFTPEGVLHFKTDCSLMDAETILSTKRLDASDCFEGYRVLHVPEGEEAAANAMEPGQYQPGLGHILAHMGPGSSCGAAGFRPDDRGISKLQEPEIGQETEARHGAGRERRPRAPHLLKFHPDQRPEGPAEADEQQT